MSTESLGNEPDSHKRLMAALGHALTFVEGGIIGPLIVYLVQKDKDPFSAFHSLQSLYFGLLFIAICIFTLGFGVILVVPYLIFELIAALKAYEGEWYCLPVVGKWALAKHPPQ
jgi:uncharacterized Tic20 family protein